MNVPATRRQLPMTSLIPRTMDEAMRAAELMSKARLVPEHLQNKPGDCLLVVEQAARWGMSPYAVAQCTSLIHGRLCYEGKLIAAAVESMGAIETHFDYTYRGEGENRTITVSAVRVGEAEPKTIDLCWKDAVTFDKEGRPQRHWTRAPDQQLAYAGTRIWARKWTPSAILGVYTREEWQSGEAFTGTTIDAAPEQSAEPLDERETINKEVPLKTDPRREWTDKAVAAFAGTSTLDEHNDVVAMVVKNLDRLRGKRPDLAEEVDEAERASRVRVLAPKEEKP